MNKSILRKKHYINENAIESFKGMGKALVTSLGTDLGKGVAQDAGKQWEQFFGINKSGQTRHREASGDLIEGEELNLTLLNRKQAQEEKATKIDIEPGIDYRRELLHGYRKIAKENTQEISKKIQEIIAELKRLTESSRELQVEFKEVAIEQRVVNPGKYHASFFEWVLSAIRLARMKVEDSGAWLSVSKSKKAKREYWAMFKKHGTTFGLSNERVVATQTG